MRTTLPAGFETCSPLGGRPDVEEGLKSILGCLILGQLLAAAIALENPPVHTHSHHKAAQSSAFGSLRKTGVAQARPQLIEHSHGALRGLGLLDNSTEPLLRLHHQVQGVAQQPPVSEQLAGKQLAFGFRVAEREAVGARRRLKLLKERVGEVGLV